MNALLKRLPLALILISLSVHAQKTVTGTVSDSFDILPGATILVKGTDQGTTTDFDGKYSIEVPDGAILVFTYLGYKDQEIEVGDKIFINVLLEEDAQALDEVVVNALGIEVDKETLGATVSKVKADQLATSGEVNLINALQAKASGVRIARSNGDPGAGAIVQIRGANTISGSTQPLIILDGVPISNDNLTGSSDVDGGTSQQSRLNDINEDDIESIDILKGASAAAIWGSEAANGVIVITTKRGRDTGKLNVVYRTTVFVDKVINLHPVQTNYGQGNNGVYNLGSIQSWGDEIASRPGGSDIFFPRNEEGYYIDQNNREWELVQTKNSKETFVERNFDKVFQDALSQKHYLSINNANDKGRYRFSIGALNQEGVIRESDYKRINVGFSGKYEFNDKLSVRSRFRYTNTKSLRIQQSSNTAGLLLGLLRNAPDFDISGYTGTYIDANGDTNENRHRSYRNPIGASTNPGYNNPLWTLYRQKSPNQVDRIIASADFDYRHNSWLRFKIRGSYDMYFDERRYFFPVHTAGRGTGRFNLDNINNRVSNFDFIARTKTLKIGGGFRGNLLTGYSFNERLRKSVYNEGANFLADTDAQVFSNSTEIEPTRHFITQRRKYRFYYTGSLDFKKQFFLNTAGAMERASTINGAFFYPSVDISWLFTKLNFLKDNLVLTHGKIRAGVGQVGVEPRAHRAQTTYETPTYSDYSDPLELAQFGGGFRFNNNLGNSNLKPEIKTEYEVGMDLKFLDNRLSLSGTYYYNTVEDILISLPTSPSTGADNIYANGASLENRGLELDLEYDFLKNNKGFKATVYGNFNNNKNKVLSILGTNTLALTSGSISSRAVVGYPMGTLWGSKALRNSDGSLDLDVNGFPQLAPEQGVLGDPNPEWRGAAGLRINYRSFFFNTLVEHSQGGVFAERTRFIMRNFGTHTDVGNTVTPTVDVIDRAGVIHPAGVPVRGNIQDFGAGPVLLNESYYTTIGGGFGSSVINEFAINQDASWTRLSEVTLGYTLNSERFREKTKLASLSFTLTGRNLALWTDILGVDPQTNQTGVSNGFGIDYFTNPASKTYSLKLEIKY
ncbi:MULTISPECIES: SusC/RagA family TonB-linked outer membrane protein [Flavobacteriaceae]|uniref:SusC/RagA family TonB-linked outer membrane protein n=1 Tax=Flavobacteriaceae TaxID=49546 RepID=UPI00149100B1|nr:MULTISPECIES: SusC/RagA family TonB-linked outer membrane protein [Allomuricauda]MDC6366071.1 SusC/RagA family TonB-linked outer membrane protein [Muricauda sp. AC10]